MGGEKEFKSPNEIPKNCHAHKIKPYFPDNHHAEFVFAPAFTGQLKVNQKIEVEGNCFEETTFEIKYDESKPSEYTVIANLQKPRSLTCSDAYLWGNTETL